MGNKKWEDIEKKYQEAYERKQQAQVECAMWKYKLTQKKYREKKKKELKELNGKKISGKVESITHQG